MTAKEYLLQLPKMQKNIDILYEDIEMRRARLESVTIPIKPDKVQTSRSGDRFADAIAAMADMEVQRRELILVYQAMIDKVTDQVLKLPNELYSDILYERYIRRRPWKTVAAKLHYSYANIMVLHVKAVQAFDAEYGPDFPAFYKSF